ncbi:MAG: metallophosphoesterase, partial [Spirochaetota bacterium]|nr:metallophosphoesterase [Spirochaetota bacterium]
NDNFRDFIDDVNDKAKAGEVDFVFITGDIVDFVQLGVSEGTKGYDNNWQLFEEILIGSDSEDDRKNVSKNGKKISGITVPVYTSTGNHDWRTNPYDPSMSEGLSNSYGLTQKEMEHFDEEFYDSIDDIRNKENEVYQNLVRRKNFISETKENIVHYILKKILIMSDNWLAKSLFPIITWITGWTIIPAKELADYLVKTPHYVFASFLLILTAYTIHAGFNQLVAWLYRKYVIKGIISLEAGSSSLYHYFLHINPHFNHAFTFGANYFIMMDTGPDCLTGQYFWDRGNKKMRRVSISDNVLGGSPDSMAFYPANEYYTYGQIAILEQILTLIKSDNIPSDREKRIFVGVHAPPANLPKIPDYLNKRKGWDDPKQVPKYDFRVADDIRFGTINHYLSQFFYLCSGTKENDFSHDGPVVDMVLAGHAHWELEFRIKRYTEKITNSNHPDNDDKKKDKNDDDKVYIGKPYININIGNYSHWVKDNKDFNYKRPFLLQTAACGPMLGDFNKPPYYRLIQVKEDGTISGFKSNNGPSPEQKHKNWFEKLCDFDENSDFDENEEV